MNPATDLLKGLLSKLNSNKVCVGIIKSAKIDLSFFGFGVVIEGMSPITDEETAIIAILEKMKKNGKRLLITIDEVRTSPGARASCHPPRPGPDPGRPAAHSGL